MKIKYFFDKCILTPKEGFVIVNKEKNRIFEKELEIDFRKDSVYDYFETKQDGELSKRIQKENTEQL